MRFATEVTLSGPWRHPAQMLADQAYDGHTSVHDDSTATSLGLAGAPIEGPTHFSQFDPLAATAWGRDWFERGCLSAHFRTMVVEGEAVQATLTITGTGDAPTRIEAHKEDGTSVLDGTASVGPAYGETEVDARLAHPREPGELFVIDQLEIGMRSDDEVVSVTDTDPNGASYPFSLSDKVARITEPHAWYTPEGGAGSPWGRAVLPIEMISVLAQKARAPWPVRTPAIGLFLDLEIRLLDGPVFVGAEYRAAKEIVAIGQSRRTESYWTRTTLTDVERDTPTAEVRLHSGVFKESYPGYPADRLAR
jgi:hypothetical protein